MTCFIKHYHPQKGDHIPKSLQASQRYKETSSFAAQTDSYCTSLDLLQPFSPSPLVGTCRTLTGQIFHFQMVESQSLEMLTKHVDVALGRHGLVVSMALLGEQLDSILKGLSILNAAVLLFYQLQLESLEFFPLQQKSHQPPSPFIPRALTSTNNCILPL